MINKNKLFRTLVKLNSDAATVIRETEEVQEAISRGMVLRHSGGLVVTEKGRQFIFQRRCVDFLSAILADRAPVASESVIKWLTKHEFILTVKDGGRWAITPRGRDWLSQIKES